MTAQMEYATKEGDFAVVEVKVGGLKFWATVDLFYPTMDEKCIMRYFPHTRQGLLEAWNLALEEQARLNTVRERLAKNGHARYV